MTVAYWLAPEWKGSDIRRHIVIELGITYREWTAIKILFCCSSITSRDVKKKESKKEERRENSLITTALFIAI